MQSHAYSLAKTVQVNIHNLEDTHMLEPLCLEHYLVMTTVVYRKGYWKRNILDSNKHDWLVPKSERTNAARAAEVVNELQRMSTNGNKQLKC